MELNVIEQCLNIFKTAVVQRKRVETYEKREGGDAKYEFTEPRIHGFVYDPVTGDLKKLQVDFGEYMTDLRAVYDLYKPDGSIYKNNTKSSSFPGKGSKEVDDETKEKPWLQRVASWLSNDKNDIMV